MKNPLRLINFAALVLVAGFALLAGCKSAPELTVTNAQALIQAKYDQTPPVGVNILVDDTGMQEGVHAKYWDRTKAYPNKFWADFKLSDTGKKVVKLASGGDTIEWHPETADDKNYTIVVTTVVANHLKAKDVKEPQDEVGGTKSAVFNEVIGMDGVPDPLQKMARERQTKVSTKRTATFALSNGAWTLQSID